MKEAVAHYKAALRLNPDFEKTHHNLGLALKQLGKIQEAINHFREALRIKPDFIKADQSLKQALKIREKDGAP